MNDQRAPFDGKMLIAIVAVVALWFGWNAHLQKKYPEHFKAKTTPVVADEASPNTTEAPKLSDNSAAPAKTTPAPVAAETQKEETTLKYKDEVWSFEISSKGMAIKGIQLSQYSTREGDPIVLASAEEQGIFATNIVGRKQPLDFVVSQPEPNKFVGVAQVGANRIVKTVFVDSSNYTFKTQVRVEDFDENFSGLTTAFSKKVPQATGWGPFASVDHHELYVDNDGSYDRHVFAVDETYTQNNEKPVIVSIASQYFALAVVDQSDSRPDVKTVATPTVKNADDEFTEANAETTLTYTVPGGTKALAIGYTAFAGPKSFDLLKSIDERLANVVNYGFFQTIGKLIFKLMQAIHAVTGNWGLAIILLTILVRILVLPFNMMSYRSMKGLSKIQPQLKLIRERYANDKVKQNEETLRLMKEANANPLGGCLPIFLQLPVFLALYQVLGQSIELYKAPFAFWIHDLSLKDPYFILPALMGVTLFVQQKITPNTMEPAQQKVMMVLPLLFAVMMASLASGLTLYIFISGLFGVLQQLYFMRDDLKREKKAQTKEAKVLSVKS